jgi:hypothetical protein
MRFAVALGLGQKRWFERIMFYGTLVDTGNGLVFIE